MKLFFWRVSHERLISNSLKVLLSVIVRKISHTFLVIVTELEMSGAFLYNLTCFKVCFVGNLQVWLAWNAHHNPGGNQFSQWPWVKIFGPV